MAWHVPHDWKSWVADNHHKLKVQAVSYRQRMYNLPPERSFEVALAYLQMHNGKLSAHARLIYFARRTKGLA